MSKRLWDAQRQEEYRKQQNEAVAQRSEEQEGVAAARDIDAVWPSLTGDERALFQYLVLCSASSCIGNCDDPLLSGLVDKGLLNWPPGVRPVLTNDLVTSFLVPSAVWAALNARRNMILHASREPAGLIAEIEQRFGKRFTPISPVDTAEPTLPGA